MTSGGDPLGSGLVASLAQPGGNVTGLSLMVSDIAGKRIELLKELLPKATRVAVLWNSANPYPALVFRETQNAARTLGIDIQSLPDALIVVEDPLTVSYRNRVAKFAISNRLAAIEGTRDFAVAGGLVAYGANISDLYRRAATYVDKILRAAKPNDLPIEQPTKFDLVFNLTTAKALGLTIPPTLLARADEVIE